MNIKGDCSTGRGKGERRGGIGGEYDWQTLYVLWKYHNKVHLKS
jgi:hypothetical protein